MANEFQRWLTGLESLGLLDVILPFMLIFTIAYAILTKSKILGPNSQRFNVILSFVIAMTAVIPHVIPGQYHYPPGADVIEIINKALPNVSMLMVAAMMVLLLMGVFGKDINIAGTSLEGIAVLFAIIGVAYSFVAAQGLTNPPSWLGFLLNDDIRGALIAIIVFGIIVSFITSEPTPTEKQKTFLESMKDWSKGTLGGGSGH